MPRSRAQRKADTLALLRTEVACWVASADEMGNAHLVPLSHYWDGAALVLATPRSSPTATSRGDFRRTTSGAVGSASHTRIRRRFRLKDLKCQRMIESGEKTCRNDSRLPLQIARPSTARAMLESWLDQIAKRRLGGL